MRCPACATAVLTELADLGEVPVLSGFTWDTAEEAAAAPTGRMELARCPACAHVVNTAFDEKLMSYSGEYDNSLHHSPTFAGFATHLAERLAATYDLRGRTVVEPGCGKGEFLRELCRVAGARGRGYDVSYVGPQEADGVRFVREFMGSTEPAPPFDFLVSRHVLEHLADPYGFLLDLRRQAGERPITGYVEVPDGRHDLAGAGWACIYPHVGYFSHASLLVLLRRAGFEILASGTAFGDVFRYAEITTAPSGRNGTAQLPPVDADLAASADLGRRHAATVRHWQGWIADQVAAGRRVALWGAGARGVELLSAVDRRRLLTAVVDSNPAKHGRYLPGTAHRVIAPRELPGHAVDTILITNPMYEAEIRGELAVLGVTAEIHEATAVT